MDTHAFEQFLLDKGVVGFDKDGITLKSGKNTHWYGNFRVLSQSQADLTKSAQFVVDFLIDNDLLGDVNGVIGVPEGATLLGLEVHRQLVAAGKLPDVVYSLRVKSKEHGKPANRFWTNGNEPKKVIVLEDVTTTGGSALEVIAKLRDAGVTVTHVVALLNRMQVNDEQQTVEQKMKTENLDYHALTNAVAILPQLLEKQSDADRELFSQLIRKEYEKEYAGLGDVPVTL